MRHSLYKVFVKMAYKVFGYHSDTWQSTKGILHYSHACSSWENIISITPYLNIFVHSWQLFEILKAFPTEYSYFANYQNNAKVLNVEFF